MGIIVNTKDKQQVREVVLILKNVKQNAVVIAMLGCLESYLRDLLDGVILEVDTWPNY